MNDSRIDNYFQEWAELDLIYLEELTNKALELKLEFLELWGLIISSYLSMVIKAKG